MYVSCFFLFFSFFILCLKRFKTRLKRLFKTCFLLTHNPIYIYSNTIVFVLFVRIYLLKCRRGFSFHNNSNTIINSNN